MIVRNILVRGLKTIPHEATMLEAEGILKEFRIRHLPVMEKGKIVGIISDRDVLEATSVLSNQEKMIYKHRKVSEFMSTPVIMMNINEDVEKVAFEMINQGVSSIVIQDENQNPVGILTTSDLLAVLIDLLNKQTGLFKRLFRF
ncbi:MAG: HPP family protein [Bacteriovoracia bacterium]